LHEVPGTKNEERFPSGFVPSLMLYDLFFLPQERDFNHEAHEEHEGGFAAEKRGLATKNAKKGGVKVILRLALERRAPVRLFNC
jgi:hypothetical protein